MATNDPQVVLIQLGIMLRRLRNAADLPASAAANHLDCSIAKISKMENGKQRILPSEVSSLLELYGADDSQTAEALRLATVPKPRRRGTYRDSVPAYFRRFLVLESEASELSIYEAEVVTGLLQAEDYARTLLRAGNPLASQRELDQQVEVRTGRKSILTKDSAPTVNVVLHEATLHRVIGSDSVMKAQIEYLIELSELPNLNLHVLPFRPKPTPSHDESFTAKAAFVLLKLEATGAVVYVEDMGGANYPEDGHVIQAYATAYQRLRNASLSAEESVTLMGKVLEDVYGQA
ncbi:Helix-turn-helix domain-containing protein [Saccharopolyspora shandongensis]|uniref:Helix-turn-helix domain-containing protein n=1 Tax=Saccharopolyspora shandongensis TaxID=418495 RepID=A0A1H3H4X8_9PSEU|nr:helix-turn-helix transcriptional regulator [Saccharopolyspora shandongensis]SDY10633.1 Helix-turn-helix domain-containing protein [Saccharopolyspora shandongensis]